MQAIVSFDRTAPRPAGPCWSAWYSGAVRCPPSLTQHPLLLLAAFASLAATTVLIGCTSGAAPSSGDRRALEQEHQQLTEQVRQQLSGIPAPTKSRYLTVHTLSGWDNPYLTVQQSMLTLHVTLPDANTSALDQGGLLRPRAARQQSLTIRVGELPVALNSVPQTAWPYGRVIAVEEAHSTPRAAQAEVRRSVENVMRTLNDLGVVAYEWPETGPGLR